jgi:Bacteriodetes cell division protein (FtsL-like)
MAVPTKKNNKLNAFDFFKGNFLNQDEVKQQYKFFLLVVGLLLLMIFANHMVDSKMATLNALKEQTEEYKSRNAYAQSKLIKIKLESELGKEMLKDSLKPLENHPVKILIKLDSAHANKR